MLEVLKISDKILHSKPSSQRMQKFKQLMLLLQTDLWSASRRVSSYELWSSQNLSKRSWNHRWWSYTRQLTS